MDFQIEMAEQILFIPRNKEIGFAHSNEETIETSYACLGMGAMEEGHPVLFDGINEKGLMGATLYFPGYADYSENIKKNQKGISPDMVIPTVLTQASNLEEIIDLFDKKFVIINDTNPTLGLTPVSYTHLPYTRSLLRSNPSAETVSDDLYVIPGSVPSLSEIEYDKDLFLARVPWMKEEAQKVISEKMTEISSNHFVRGQAWKKFEFPDQKLKGGKK